MRNNSQRPGCMRRLPASHSCHPRKVQWISAAAAVCESPAASRAARTSAGVGFAEGPLGPRFGWLGTFRSLENTTGAAMALVPHDLFAFLVVADFIEAAVPVVLGQHRFDRLGVLNDAAGAEQGNFGGIGGHFHLQPLIPRRGGQQRAVHELNYTRNACNIKRLLRKFNEAPTPPHNAEVRGAPPALSAERPSSTAVLDQAADK